MPSFIHSLQQSVRQSVAVGLHCKPATLNPEPSSLQQLVAALEYMHHHNVAHRDLKLDNLLLMDTAPPRLKLCDFGFAKKWEEDDRTMYTQIGTPVYMSPQQINSKKSRCGYDAVKADVWALGVLIFVMLLGMFPFDHTDHPDPNSSDAHVEVGAGVNVYI